MCKVTDAWGGDETDVRIAGAAALSLEQAKRPTVVRFGERVHSDRPCHAQDGGAPSHGGGGRGADAAWRRRLRG